MKLFVWVAVVVAALMVVTVVLQEKELQRAVAYYVENDYFKCNGEESPSKAEACIESYIERQGTLFRTFGVGGMIFVWLFTSAAGWVLCCFLGMLLRELGVDFDRPSSRTAQQIATYVHLSESGQFDQAHEYIQAAYAEASRGQQVHLYKHLDHSRQVQSWLSEQGFGG